MPWHHYPACFFGGAFLANFVPHFVAGVSGRPFPSPFGKPPFRGLSSPASNVLWGVFNSTVAYLLLVFVADVELQRTLHVVVAALGFTLTSVALARKLARLQGGEV